MKAKKKYLLIFSFLLLSNCSDENLTESKFAKYRGTWLWIQTSGGFAGRTFKPPAGTSVKIIFDSFGFYREYKNDSLKVIAEYTVSESNLNRDKISFSNVTTFNYVFYPNIGFAIIKSDTLDIWDGWMDGYFRFYKKIK